MRKIYATDLSDSEWACLRDRLPELPRRVKTRTHSLRDIFDAIFYILKTGCQWRLLPHDFPPWQTVFYHFRRFRLSGMWHRISSTLRAEERKRVGKDPDTSAAITDSQSVKTTEEGAGSSGYDVHKNVKGRKRHLLVDALGLPLSICVTSADVQDRAGARLLLAGLGPLVPRSKKIWASFAGSVQRQESRRVMRGAGWMGDRGRRARRGHERLRGPAETLDRRADLRVVA